MRFQNLAEAMLTVAAVVGGTILIVAVVSLVIEHSISAIRNFFSKK